MKLFIKKKHIKFYNTLTKNTIRDEINRICGVADVVYSLGDKLARVDGALDEYWKLANDAAPKLGLDDTGNTSIPVETQNLVSGTNNYKISSFTNKVLQIIRIAVLNDDGIEGEVFREEFDNLDRFNEDYDTAVTGVPDAWIKIGDYIYLRPTPNYSETSGLRAYVSRELSKFTPVTFTTTHATELINAVAHGLVNGDTVLLSTSNTLPAGFSADTVYYVINKTDDTFQVAAAGGGSAVAITSDGTGTHQFIKLSKEPGIPEIHHKYLARKAALDFLIETNLSKAASLAQLIVIDERNITEYWQNMDRTLKTVIKPRTRVFD